MAGGKDIARILRAHYDKIIAAVVLAALLGMLVYLGFRVGALSEEQDRFQDEINIAPLHLKAAEVNMAAYAATRHRAERPFRFMTSTNTPVFTPETRVTCVDCRKPIPLPAQVCPFCKAPQPPPATPIEDADADGMKDEWEMKYGLSPRDSTDAGKDADGDDFTNREEHDANTDPADPQSAPPIAAKLCVKKIEADPFQLLFKSVIKVPDGSLKFAINTRRNRTYFVSLGQEVEGFKLEKYDPKTVGQERGGIHVMTDRSVLTLSRGGKTIPLTMGEDVPYVEQTAHLVLMLDESAFVSKVDKLIDVRGQAYRLIEIDTPQSVVVLERESDKLKVRVRPCADK